jgi:hypothetical protein
MTRPVLVGQFWGLDSDRILKLVLREIILSQEIQMPPGVRRTMGHRLSNSSRLRSRCTRIWSKGLTGAPIQLISGHKSQKESRGLPTPVT